MNRGIHIEHRDASAAPDRSTVHKTPGCIRRYGQTTSWQGVCVRLWGLCVDKLVRKLTAGCRERVEESDEADQGCSLQCYSTEGLQSGGRSHTIMSLVQNRCEWDNQCRLPDISRNQIRTNGKRALAIVYACGELDLYVHTIQMKSQYVAGCFSECSTSSRHST